MRSIAFLFCSFIGYVIGHHLLTGAAAAYTSSIVSYHLYLGILIFLNEKKAGLSMAPMETTLTHLSFLAIVIGLPYLRAHIPFFGIIGLFIPALAPFEVNWLFGKDTKGNEKAVRKEKEQIPIESLLNEATNQDHAEFLEYMKQPSRAFRKQGRGVREEYAYWLADRASRKMAAAARPAGQEPRTDAADA